MDYSIAIKKVYEHADNGHVDKAVIECLRIAQHMKDYFYASIFRRELGPNNKAASRSIIEDTEHLGKDAQKWLLEKSRDYWLETHTLEFGYTIAEDGEKCNILVMTVGALDQEIEQCERSINDIAVPQGMDPYDTAQFTDRYTSDKLLFRQQIKNIMHIKEKIKARCLNYVIGIEKQLDAQHKTQSFLEQAQNDVNNFFKAHSVDVYAKLVKASQLVNSNNQEDQSALLGHVRRSIKASADFFYPPTSKIVKCADGEEREMGEEQYLNRLQEFLLTRFSKSSSRDLLKAELNYLAEFARRLNDIASKGIHASVSFSEAKQGLLGLYLFWFFRLLYGYPPYVVLVGFPDDLRS